jgi:hypothetical protein
LATKSLDEWVVRASFNSSSYSGPRKAKGAMRAPALTPVTTSKSGRGFAPFVKRATGARLANGGALLCRNDAASDSAQVAEKDTDQDIDAMAARYSADDRPFTERVSRPLP